MLGRRIVILTAMAGLGLPWATAQAGGPHVVVGVGLGVPFYPRPYWGYPYGCYPTWGYYGTYNYGTIVMQMGDYKNLPQPTPPGTQVALVWNGAVYGVLGTQQYNLQRVLTGIDQAFAQSPYISKQ